MNDFLKVTLLIHGSEPKSVTPKLTSFLLYHIASTVFCSGLLSVMAPKEFLGNSSPTPPFLDWLGLSGYGVKRSGVQSNRESGLRGAGPGNCSQFEKGEAHIRTILKVRGTSYVSFIYSAWHRACLLKE